MKTVCLETARKLKEAGYPQESNTCITHFDADDKQWYGMPCACEILEQLPKRVFKEKQQQHEFCLRYDVQEQEWFCGYFCIDWDKEDWCWFEFSKNIMVAHNSSLAEACAELWLWAKKEGYVK